MSLWNDIIKKLTTPLTLTLVIAAGSILTGMFNINPELLGLHPRDPDHWLGILTVPLVHGSAGHLYNNLLAFVVLSSLLYLTYSPIANRIMALAWLLTGVAMFCFARSAYFHIGASGVVYALIFFLVTAGFMVRRRGTLAVSFVVALYYGGAIWGVFPLEPGVSWDGHLSGAVVGVLLAFFNGRTISRRLPAEPKPAWMDEEDEGTTNPDEYDQFGR